MGGGLLVSDPSSLQQKTGKTKYKAFDLEYASQKQIKSIFQTVCPLAKSDGRDLGIPVA